MTIAGLSALASKVFLQPCALLFADDSWVCNVLMSESSMKKSVSCLPGTIMTCWSAMRGWVCLADLTASQKTREAVIVITSMPSITGMPSFLRKGSNNLATASSVGGLAAVKCKIAVDQQPWPGVPCHLRISSRTTFRLSVMLVLRAVFFGSAAMWISESKAYVSLSVYAIGSAQ